MKSIPILNIFSNHKYKYAIPFNNDICFMDSISKTLVHKVKPLSIRKIDKHESYIYYNEILFNTHITVKHLFNPNLDFIIKSFEKLLTDCRCAVIITRLVKCLVTSEISLRKEILRQSPKGGAEEWH